MRGRAANQRLALSKDITFHVIEFIARTVHFLVQQERRHSRRTSLFGLSMLMKGQKNGTLSHLYDRIGARAVKARATKSEGCIWHCSEHRWCDGNIPRPDQ